MTHPPPATDPGRLGAPRRLGAAGADIEPAQGRRDASAIRADAGILPGARRAPAAGGGAPAPSGAIRPPAPWALRALLACALLAIGSPARGGDGPAPPGAVVDPACLGAPLAAVRLVGCQSTSCPGAEDQARVLSLAGLAPGVTLESAAVERAYARLSQTRLFSRVALACAPGDAGPTAELRVAPPLQVRFVRIFGNQVKQKREILRRVFLRAGTVLEADPERPMESEQIARQVDAIQRFYANDGLEDVTVAVRLVRVAEDQADLELHVAEGDRARIDRIAIEHRHTPRPDPDGLRCPTITPRRLERLAGVDFGDVQTANLRRQVRERLRRAFQAVGYLRPGFEHAPEGADVRGAFEETVLTERCWLIRVWERAIPIEDTDVPAFRASDPADPAPAPRAATAPFRRASLDDWASVLPFGESGVFDREEAARGIAAIERTLAARGHAFARVTMEHRELALTEERRGVDSEVRGVIDYHITLNHEHRIRGVRFPGVEAFSEAALRDLLASEPYDFFGAAGYFELERVLVDLVQLERFFADRGFFDLRFLVHGHEADAAPRRIVELATEELTIWRYTFRERGFLLRKLRDDPSLYLEIPIAEGPRSVIGRFDVVGNEQLDADEVSAITRLAPGRPYGPHYLAAGVARLEAWYRARGYYQVRIEPFCEAHAPRTGDDLCDPRLPVRAELVDLGLRITEGAQVFVGEIFWRGNFRTDPHALTRDLPRPGEPLDQARLDEAMRRIRALGLFNSVRIDIIGLDEDPPRDRVALVVSVEETGYRFLDVALGVRSIQRQNLDRIPPWAASAAGNLVSNIDRATTGFGRAFPLDIPDVLVLFELEYLDLNIAGLGHQLRLPVRAGVSTSQLLRLASFNPTYAWPRLGDTILRLEGRVIAELDRVTDPLDRLEVGAELDLSLPLSRQMLAGLTLRSGLIQLRPPGEPCFFCLEASELGFGSSLVHQAGRELVDGVVCGAEDATGASLCERDPFRPQITVGLRWRWDEQDNPLHPTRGFALTASTSFILDRDRESATVIFNRFLKWELAGRLTIDLGGPLLAIFARYGGSSTFGEDFLPANERFTLGGANGLRGYGDNAVCRYDERGELDADCPGEFGGNVVVNGSLELRAPILESLGVWIAAFIDAGAIARGHKSLYPASFRGSAGLGLRWLIGGQIPIRLDIGFPLDRRCLMPIPEGGCVLEDASAVHFDFLYPF